MRRWHYVHSGLQITSDLPLPEWALFERPALDGAPDVTIRSHATPMGRSDPAPSRVTPDGCDFSVSDVGRYQVRSDGNIAVWAQAGADPCQVRALLLGSAWGAFCHLRGLLMLHASVVQIADAVVAFCGESGAGKSTLAAWMSAAGHTIISDDLCRVALPADGPPVVYRSATRLKLWRDALTRLGWEEDGLARDQARMEKFHVPLDGGDAYDQVPLAALYLPVWGHDLAVRRLTGLTALRRLIGAATYRGELLEPMGRLGGYWSLCAELVRRVPVWELCRPREPAHLPDTVTLVRAHAASHQERRSGQPYGYTDSGATAAGAGV